MPGNIICMLALYGCIPMVLYVFTKYRADQAVIISFFGALMFLPMAQGNVPLILYTKMTATAIGVMIAIKIYDPDKLEEAAFHPVDIPMACWCFSGFVASVTNGLGPKDGIQEAFNTFTIWGIPYLAGRLYFANTEGIKMLCRAIFAGGLIYIPFVLFELKMSPQSHRIVYGYMQHDFSQVIRGGGYRPMVFMEHGIMLGTWMCMGALVGLWCTLTKAFPKKMWRVPTLLLTAALTGTAVACKSSGALGMMFLGLLALVVSWKLRTGLLVWLLLMVPATYVGTRATGYWDGQNLVDFITEKFSEDRAKSLKFRFENENILVEKAQQRALFGWGGWGRSRVIDEESNEDKSTTDGFWIIALGTRGYFGLFSVALVLILPTLLFLLKCPPRLWGKPEYAPTAVISLIPLLFMIDCLLNGMINQAYIIFAGGASGLLATRGLAGLKESDAPESDASPANSAPPKTPIQVLRNMGSGRFRESETVMTPAATRRFMGDAANVGTRIGLSGTEEGMNEPTRSPENEPAARPVESGLKKWQGTEAVNRSPDGNGPRGLQSPLRSLGTPEIRGIGTGRSDKPFRTLEMVRSDTGEREGMERPTSELT